MVDEELDIKIGNKAGWPCPACGAKTKTIDSRRTHRTAVRRRRECPKCPPGTRYTTYEVMEGSDQLPPWMVTGAGLLRTARAALEEIEKLLAPHLEDNPLRRNGKVDAAGLDAGDEE